MQQKISSIIRWTIVVLGVYVIFSLVSSVYGWISGTSLKDVVFLFASDLATDSQNRTNFLLVGTGGEEHTDGGRTDSVIVASFDHDEGTLAMLSLPRDLWVEADDGQGMRINNIYLHELDKNGGDSEEALEALAEVASRVANVPIHYFAKINFNGFADLVDALGGVDILVEDSISDPYYPCKNMVDYCPFEIDAGYQHLDGGTALKYARSRKTTSDFSRAARQQQVIEAIREKALKGEVLKSPRKLKEIYGVVSDNLETNLDFRDLIRLGRIAEDFNQQNMATVVLSDNPHETGGLLYPPPRVEYGGASVLVPVGENYQKIHDLTGVLFGHPRVAVDQLPIEILNGSGEGGVALSAAYYLNRYDLNSAHAANNPDGDVSETTIYFYDEKIAAETLEQLTKFVQANVEKGPADLARRGYDITLVLGEDWELPEYIEWSWN